MILDIKGDVKSIPIKYKCLENIEDYIDDLHHARLTVTERENLNIQLLRHKMSDIIAEIRSTPGLRDIIQIAEPVVAMKVNTRNETYHIIRFSNGKEVRCKASLFKGSPVKETINRLY
jgi:hypothetical protein